MRLRLLFLAGVLAAVLPSGAPPVGLVGVLALTAAATWWVSSLLSSGALAGTVLLWAWGGRDLADPWVLVAVGGLVVAHVAAHLAVLGPRGLVLDRGTVRRWALRGCLLGAAGLAVWTVLSAVRVPAPAQIWAVGAVGAVVGVGALLALLNDSYSVPGVRPSSRSAASRDHRSA